MYTIKQVSKMLNCNANAIRFYEKKRLIAPIEIGLFNRFNQETM